MRSTPRRGVGSRNTAIALTLLSALITGCSSSAAENTTGSTEGVLSSGASTSPAVDVDTRPTETQPLETEPTEPDKASTNFFDETSVHTISVEFDATDYAALIAKYRDDGEKAWMKASVTIDGSTYRQVGLRLKGNSSLFGIGGGPGLGGLGITGRIGDAREVPPECAAAFAAAFGGGPPQPPTSGAPGVPVAIGPGGGISSSDPEKPETLPWLIRLDKYVEDQQHDGHTDFVVRSNNSQTSLNEAVALDLLHEADLASQRAAMVRLSVNGGNEAVRLVIELPNEQWSDATFDEGGSLYKAESGGTWTYNGRDPDSYATAWDQEGGPKDMTTLIDFLDFVNNSTDTEFAAKLEDRLDVNAFARYLAMEELLVNFDDIDGPGNNAYLYFAKDTGRATVVAWDHNYAFSSLDGPITGARGGPAIDFSEIPENCRPEGVPTGSAPGSGGPVGGGSNPLVERFMKNPRFKALYEDAKADLTARVFTSGTANDTLTKWSSILEDGAEDLLTTATITKEGDSIRGKFVTG